MDNLDLEFDRVSFEVSFLDLVEQGYLAKPRYVSYNTGLSHKLRSSGEDFSLDDLRQLNNEKRNNIIAKDYAAHKDEYGKTLTFCVDVEHCWELQKAFQRHCPGTATAVITGSTAQGDRAQILDHFKRGLTDVLFNVTVFTEGFDEPSIKTVQMARPTKSEVLWCLDDKTEILTKAGWKNVDSIDPNTDIAATWDNGKIAWSPILGRVDREATPQEEFYSLDSPRMSIRVTDQHRMIGWSRWEYENKRLPRIREACNLPSREFYIPVSGIEDVDDCHLNDDELRFLGWFISDGTLDLSNNTIRIGQRADHDWTPEIQKMLDGAGLAYQKYEYLHPVNNAPTVRFVIPYGGGRKGKANGKLGWWKLEEFIDKQTGEAYETLSRRQLGVMLEALHLGDGQKQVGQSWTRRSYHLCLGDNHILADRLQSLCVRRGYACNQARSTPKPSDWNADPKEQCILHIKDQITRSIGCNNPTDRKGFKFECAADGERVWCIETNVGTIITRRKGKVAVLGNCQSVGRASRPDPTKPHFNIVDYVDGENNYGILAENWAVRLLGVEESPESTKRREDAITLEQFKEWARETGWTGKLPREKREVLEIDGILEVATRRGTRRYLVRKNHKERLDRLANQVSQNPPSASQSMDTYIMAYADKKDKSLLRWPGKYHLTNIAWGLYFRFVKKNPAGFKYKQIPDFSVTND